MVGAFSAAGRLREEHPYKRMEMAGFLKRGILLKKIENRLTCGLENAMIEGKRWEGSRLFSCDGFRPLLYGIEIQISGC